MESTTLEEIYGIVFEELICQLKDGPHRWRDGLEFVGQHIDEVVHVVK
jgi:hypothetical protein